MVVDIIAKSALVRRPKNLAIALVALCFAYKTISEFSSPFDYNDLMDADETPPLNLYTPRFLKEKNFKKENEGRNNDHRKLKPGDRHVKVEVNDHHASQRAIAMISFGEEAAEGTLLERCILSIRRRGRFQGHVVVITDAPKERYEGEFDENVIILKANEDDIFYDYFEAPGNKYKRFKTLLIDYIDRVPELDEIDWIYYMDIDMMMGASFNEFARILNHKYGIEETDNNGSSKDESSPSKVYMFKDPHASKFALNSGFIAMNRHTSKPCLDIWRQEMDNHPHFLFDQLAINEVINNKEGNCEMVPMDIGRLVAMPSGDVQLKEMMKRKHYSHLIHLFNSCRADDMSEKITNRFMANVLFLTEEEKKSHWFGKQVIHAHRKI